MAASPLAARVLARITACGSGALVIRRRLRILLAAGAAAIVLLAATEASAQPSQMYIVFWQQDLALKPQIEQLFGCLATSSTFGTTWAAQFGVAPVTFAGAYVLQQAPPTDLTLGGNLDQLMANAFAQNLVPPPAPGSITSYVAFNPTGTNGYGPDGSELCHGTGYCGVHSTTVYNGISYDLAIVPLDCPDCGGGIDNATITGEHEAAEGLADLGTAGYEVGDGCETTQTQLACCGNSFAIQPLAGAGGPNDCQTINATGSSCACGSVHSACTTPTDCCQGLACQPTVTMSGGTPTNLCCNDVGAACTSRADCCGALACTGGACACGAAGQACVRPSDCCQGTSCDETSHQCMAPAPPDAGLPGHDAGAPGSGGNPGAHDGGSVGPPPSLSGPDAGGPAEAPPAGGGASGPHGCACKLATPEPRNDALAVMGTVLVLAGLGGRRGQRRRD
jgi:hypothetical protein